MKIYFARDRGVCGRCFGSHLGFTLVEVLISLVILVIILMGLAIVPIMSTQLLSDSIEREKAIQLGVGKLDQLEGFPLNEIEAGSEMQGEFILSWDVSGNNSIGKSVSLDVIWMSLKGPKTISLTRQYASGDQ